MRFNQRGDISTLNGNSLKLVDKFTYQESSVTSTEKDINTRLAKAVDKLSIIWNSDLTDEIKRNFFQTAVVSILLYGCTTWTLTKRMKKKHDGNYTRILQAIVNKSWRQHPTKQQPNGHLPPITKLSKLDEPDMQDELISDILRQTPSHGRAKVGRPARTYIQQLCADTGYSLEDLTGTMDHRDGWWERVREIRAGSETWWSWYT